MTSGCACQRAGNPPVALGLHVEFPKNPPAADVDAFSAWCVVCGEVWAITVAAVAA